MMKRIAITLAASILSTLAHAELCHKVFALPSTQPTNDDPLNRDANYILSDNELAFVRSRNHDTFEFAKTLKNFTSFRKWITGNAKKNSGFTQDFESYSITVKYDIDTGETTFDILPKGGPKSSRERIFSTKSLKGTGYRIGKMQISDGLLALSFNRWGSTDEAELVIVDLNTKYVVLQKLIDRSDSFDFISRSELYFTGKDNTLYSYKMGEVKQIAKDAYYKVTSRYVYFFSGGDVDFYSRLNRTTNQVDTFYRQGGYSDRDQYIGEFKGYSFYLVSFNGYAILELEEANPSGRKFNEIIYNGIPFAFHEMMSASIQNGHIVYDYKLDGRSHTAIQKLGENTAKIIPLPISFRTTSLTLSKDASTLTIKGSNLIHDKIDTDYDLKTNRFKSDLEYLSRKDGVQYRIDIIWVNSPDGARVPVEIAFMDDGSTRSRPSVMQVYGGFALNGYMSGGFNPYLYEFLKRGGLVIHPGVRGGVEKGTAWIFDGINKNKENTYIDTASVARYFIDKGMTTPQQLTLMGASNGGLTVAATALYYKDLFGLVVPSNGVDDIENFQRLDGKYQAYWSTNFGDLKDKFFADLWKKLAPIQNAKNIGSTQFLIVNGRTDTRVNPHHSVNLSKALEQYETQENQALLVSLDKSGHFATSVDYSGHQGIYLTSLIWSLIYERAGYKF